MKTKSIIRVLAISALITTAFSATAFAAPENRNMPKPVSLLEQLSGIKTPRATDTYEGKYLTLEVSASNWPSATITNNQTSTSRYAYVSETAYNASSQIVSNKSNSGAITTGGKTAMDTKCKNFAWVDGYGYIRSNKQSNSDILESKTITVTP